MKSIHISHKIILFSLLLGVLFFYLSNATVSKVKKESSVNLVSFNFTPSLLQGRELYLSAYQAKILSITCGQTKQIFTPHKNKWFEKERYRLTLEEDTPTVCHVALLPKQKEYQLLVATKMSSWHYSVLFLLWGVPFIYMVFKLLLMLVSKAKEKSTFSLATLPPYKGSAVQTRVLLSILALGLTIRALYFYKFGVMHFQHDWHGHIEFIQYIAQHWELPMPSKGLEYPQQPLYYLLMGALYNLMEGLHFTHHEILWSIGLFSQLCGLAFLWYAYRFILLLSSNFWVQRLFLGFLALTPSIVYMSARINNDVLVMALSAFSLYAIVKSYKTNFATYFLPALVATSLLFLTKISAAPIELFLFSLLLLSLLSTSQPTQSQHYALFAFMVVGLYLLGWTLLRVYIPSEGLWHFVNSSAYFQNQHIAELNSRYFFSFHLFDLLKAGQGYVFGADSIRFSFLTYQYATMFFGEFDYSKTVQAYPLLKPLMQTILTLGLLYLWALFYYLFNILKHKTLHHALMGIWVVTILLVLKFMQDYPVVCNTDFRYYVGALLPIALIIARGTFSFSGKESLNYLFKGVTITLFTMELLFYIFLLR